MIKYANQVIFTLYNISSGPKNQKKSRSDDVNMK